MTVEEGSYKVGQEPENEFSPAFSKAYDAMGGMGCQWPISYAGCSSCGPLDAAIPEDKAMFETMAAQFLWNWTGRLYGLCPVVVRPCRVDCWTETTFWGRGPYSAGYALDHSPGGWYGPVLVGGQWYNVACGSCGTRGCSCTGGTRSLMLPGPVASVSEVLQDGAVLDPAAYRVDNYNFLVRLDGHGWPACQDIVAAPTEPGTLQITYQRGLPVPMGGSVAAGVLACELAKAACRDATCALPQRIQSITRQGVTVAVLDSFSDVNQGATGIWLIDSWVSSITQPKRGGQVYSVDIPRPRNRITTWP